MKKNRKLNNKGYMLVEIILASVIAFGLAYYMLELTIKLKNKNDDLLVETMAMTDNAIISNAIMKYLIYNDEYLNDCSIVLIDINDKTVKLNGNFVTKVNDYVTVSDSICNLVNGDTIHVVVPLSVEQQNNKKYDVDIYYKIKRKEGA